MKRKQSVLLVLVCCSVLILASSCAARAQRQARATEAEAAQQQPPASNAPQTTQAPQQPPASNAPQTTQAPQQPPASNPSQPLQSGTQTLQHNNYNRSYELHVPPSLPANQPVALVLVFHGGAGSGKTTERLTNFSAMADKQGFVVVYPDGVGREWHDQPDTTPEAKAIDDVGFVSALIDRLSQAFRIDPNRVYSTGISNGAGLSYRLACELSGKIAAIGPVAGALGVTEAAQCHPDHPVAVIDFHGTGDPIIDYNGGAVKAGRNPPVLLSTPDTVARWRQIDGCPAPGQTQTLAHHDAADTTRLKQQLTGPCKAGTAVNAYTIVDGGHTWPGGSQYLPVARVGRVNKDINATDAIWNFFAQHPRQ
ncbi:MAG: esterase [Herpetosiphonaceae bacterium]|nr:esterase [Herpetosiphonaceae bacterium]